MRAEFRRAIDAARQHDEPAGRIAVVKRAVGNEIISADPAVRVRFTDYFNHSLAPDLILEWPNEHRQRYLFVRPMGSNAWLLNDVRLVASQRPVVFALEDLGSADADPAVSPRKSLQAAAATAGTWITDSTGTEAISSIRTQSSWNEITYSLADEIV